MDVNFKISFSKKKIFFLFLLLLYNPFDADLISKLMTISTN